PRHMPRRRTLQLSSLRAQSRLTRAPLFAAHTPDTAPEAPPSRGAYASAKSARFRLRARSDWPERRLGIARRSGALCASLRIVATSELLQQLRLSFQPAIDV